MGSPGMSSGLGFRQPSEGAASASADGEGQGSGGGAGGHRGGGPRAGQEAGEGPAAGGEGRQGSRLRVRKVSPELPLAERMGEVREAGFEAFARTGNWVVFYREMLSVDGVCRRAFPDADEWERFVASDVHRDLQEMLAALRGQDPDKAMAVEPEKMITIRLPSSLHKSLHREAKAANLSLNKLCISKLLQSIDGRFVPDHRGGIPGPKMMERRVVPGQ